VKIKSRTISEYKIIYYGINSELITTYKSVNELYALRLAHC